jgi:hypothetical protein
MFDCSTPDLLQSPTQFDLVVPAPEVRHNHQRELDALIYFGSDTEGANIFEARHSAAKLMLTYFSSGYQHR